MKINSPESTVVVHGNLHIDIYIDAQDRFNIDPDNNVIRLFNTTGDSGGSKPSDSARLVRDKQGKSKGVRNKRNGASGTVPNSYSI